MSLPSFDYLEPATVAEACALLAADPDNSAVFAGGTDLVVNLRARVVSLRRLVSLRRVSGLERLEIGRDGLSIGAMVTVNQVARHQEIAKRWPGISDAARSLGAEQVRNLATVVGNLCMAVPSADMAPILLAWGARLHVTSSSGLRTLPLDQLFVGPRKTVLGRDDVVVDLAVDVPEPGSGDASLRQGGRESLSLPLASAAAVVVMDGDTCRRATVALGAVAPTPILVPALGERLVGQRLTPELLAEAAELAAEASRPIDDLRASRAFRLELVKVLTRRALALAAERARGGR